MTKPITVTVASYNQDAIYKATGPLRLATISGGICKMGSNREAWAMINALSALNWGRLSRAVHGAEYADKKLPVTIRTASPELIRLCVDAATWEEPEGDYGVLHHLLRKFSLSYQLIEKSEVQSLVAAWVELQKA